MAFDQPLDADRVDNLNLFGAFIRAPIIGTLMWLVGGEKARKEEERMEREKITKAMMEDIDEGSATVSTSCLKGSLLGTKKCTMLTKTPPSLVGSEISDIGACAESLEGMHLIESKTNDAKPSLKRCKKELSWSDESGMSLVQYIDESVRCEPGAAMSRVKRPALSQTSSTRSELQSSKLSEKSYLPKSIEMHHSGVKMPTFSHGEPYGGVSGAAATGGGDSPLWGWYTNLTPPTPEMYYNRPHTRRCTSSSVSSDSSSTSTNTPAQALGPNRVFQDLQDKNRSAPLAFPAVPL